MVGSSTVGRLVAAVRPFVVFAFVISLLYTAGVFSGVLQTTMSAVATAAYVTAALFVLAVGTALVGGR